MIKNILTFINWWNVSDYDAANKKAELDILKRQVRGNVRLKNGHIMSRNDLDLHSKRADKDMKSLSKKMIRFQ